MTSKAKSRDLAGGVLVASAKFSAAVNYDFCPWANRYVYWLKRPIGWFVVGALAGALIGLFLAPQSWFVCGVLTAVMVLGVAWPWISMRGLTASLAFDRRRAREGNTVELRVAVRNRWPWPAWGLVIERGFFGRGSGGEDSPAVVALARVPGWSSANGGRTLRHAPATGGAGTGSGTGYARRAVGDSRRCGAGWTVGGR